MTQYINGPVNYIQLKGEIHGVSKNILLFMDSHKLINNQTQCDSYESDDISHYLYKKIKYAKDELDFFMEIRNSQIKEFKTNKRDIYMKDVINMFKTEFIVEKDKVKYAKSNPKVRLHYLDVRDHLGLFYVSQLIEYELNGEIKLLKENNDVKNIANIKKNLYIIEKLIKEFDLAKQFVSQNNKKYTQTNPIKYYLNKIINEYTDKELKEHINNFINIEYINIIANINSILTKIKIILDKWDSTKINNLIKLADGLYEFVIDLYSLFTDAYLLRRILDKDYVVKAITYTGSQHAFNYIYFLVKFYDFSIVNLYKSIESDKNVIIEKIKNADYTYNIYKLFTDTIKESIQCISIPDHSLDIYKNRLIM